MPLKFFACPYQPLFLRQWKTLDTVAAAMSTADSQLLVASSSFTSDIYKPVIRKNASDKEALWVGRIVVLIIAVIAYFIASSKSEAASGIMNLVENANKVVAIQVKNNLTVNIVTREIITLKSKGIIVIRELDHGNAFFSKRLRERLERALNRIAILIKEVEVVADGRDRDIAARIARHRRGIRVVDSIANRHAAKRIAIGLVNRHINREGCRLRFESGGIGTCSSYSNISNHITFDFNRNRRHTCVSHEGDDNRSGLSAQLLRYG